MVTQNRKAAGIGDLAKPEERFKYKGMAELNAPVTLRFQADSPSIDSASVPQWFAS